MKPDTVITDLGVIGYQEAYELQHRISDAKTGSRLDEDVILVLEHFPVFTLGKRGGAQNLMKEEQFLEKRGIPLIQTRRGGDITYHGPGQVIVYPIIDLARAGIGVADFVDRIEDVTIKACDAFGVKAERNPKNHGIWVGPNKVGSIGLAIQHGVCHHGLGFNVTTDLTPFSWVNPCGLQGVGMTSVALELERQNRPGVPDILDRSKKLIIKLILESLGAGFRQVSRSQLDLMLEIDDRQQQEKII